MAAKIFRINYKSDFILTMNSEAGWTIPFCIKFWTSIPMRAYYVGFDGTTYTHCAYDPAEPTKLLVQFDDHHLPIGNLHFQIAYHFTVEDFPNNTEDEVFNATPITTEIDGETYQVMLDFTGETAPGIDFNMPSVGVTSVNGKIGAVTLNAEDVGAQPTIDDLATIRSGAAAGATAVQPATLQEGLATKQNVISDLATIRSGAAAGATAVQPAAMNTALAAKQDTLTFDNTPTANSSNPVKSSGIKTALDAKQSTISTVNVTVDNNTGTPSGSASVSGSTLSLSFQNLKGATGATGATGPQGPQGERGLPGESGVTGDVSGFTVIQTIDPSATYGATDIAGAAALQAANAELTELEGELALGAVYDVSVHNNNATFASLSALLSDANLDTLIPTAVRKGGMSVKFIQSSDNKYVQYRLTANEWSINTENWAIADEGVYVENSEFVRVVTDSENKILYGIKSNGEFYFGAGCPQQVKDYVQTQIDILMGQGDITEKIDTINEMIAFFEDITHDETLQNLLQANAAAVAAEKSRAEAAEQALSNAKVDKVVGKSLIDAEFAEGISQVENSEFVEVHTDAKDKILYGVKPDGDFYFGAGIPSQIKKETDNIEVNVEHKVDKEEGKSLINEEFANGISYQELSDLSILIDANNRIIGRVLNNGKVDFPTQKMFDVEIDDSYVYKMTDNKGRTLFGVKKDMSVDWFINVPQSIIKYVKSLIDSRLTDAYQLNKAQEQNLLAAARYNTDYGKCVQMLLVSDSHGGFVGVQRAADICKNVPSVDAIIHLGDIVGWTPNDLALDDVAVATTIEILKTSNRPFFVVSGNHDVGTVKDIYFTRTHEQVYTDLVKPMIDNGILSNGEYQTTGGWSERCYYYHDFKTTKIRLIVLYDYDMDLVLDDNEYWEPIAYDSSKGKIERGTTYTYDPNNPIILNCGGWKNNSFRLKKTVTTITSSVGINNYTKGTFPWYKLRSFSYHSKKQMDWLANVLNTTPDGYGIVIASHQIPVFPATISDNAFSIGSNPQNTYHPNSDIPYDTVMQTALVMKIVNAWKNKTSITERIVVKDTPIQTTLQNGDYLNALEDGSGKYAYIFNADFSNRQNNNAYFINFISGHEHCDIIAQSVDYSDLFCLTTTTSDPKREFRSDMPRTENQSSPAYDCLTVLTWAKDRNIACKWGCTKTIAGIDRSYVKL